MAKDSDNTASGSPLSGKRVLLGITGGIAAYKSAYLTRILKREGADVWVCMTRAGARFITPLTMETLSQREVLQELFPEKRMVSTRHITIAEWADVFVIAPATANILAKIRAGMADDLLTTLIAATEVPVFVAPTMNSRMYHNAATQENMAVLRARGVHFIEPGTGDLACDTVGVGRMAEPDEIAAVLRNFFAGVSDLRGRKVLVTAGPTHEPLDPVRYIGNRSSGKMGYNLAEAATARGAEVTIIAGPCTLPDPGGAKIIRVETAAQMNAAVGERFAETDVVIMAAAVADFRPAKPADQKIKKSSAARTIELKPTADILLGLGKRKTHQILVGFALETEGLTEKAGWKLKDKNLDLVVANNPLLPGAGFGGDTNIATLIDRAGKIIETGKITKRALAEMICDHIVSMLPPAASE
jgi:phosphopantothenoylcysteine decarboxylase/phosphopantothenate--cysteine ligase